MSRDNFCRSNVSTCVVFTALFLTLKLCRVIDWSWWWVFAPVWGPFAITFVVMGAIGTISVICKIITIATSKGR